MKLNVKALAGTAAVVWGAVVLLTAAANLARPEYGRAFLDLLSSIYPGYHASGTAADVVVGTLYGLADGAIFGLVFGWLYNRLAVGRGEAAPVRKTERQTPVEP